MIPSTILVDGKSRFQNNLKVSNLFLKCVGKAGERKVAIMLSDYFWV